MLTDVEHLFMYLLVICMSSLKKMSIQIFCPFFNQTVFSLLSCKSSLYILDISPLSYKLICKYFLPFNRLPFHFVDGFFCCSEAFQFGVVQLYFCCCCLCFWCQIQKIITKIYAKELPSIFSSSSFMVSGFTLKSLIHFELIFVYGIR